MLHHSEFIAAIAKLKKPQIYLELGLCQGKTFSSVIPFVQKKAYGVEMIPNNNGRFGCTL